MSLRTFPYNKKAKKNTLRSRAGLSLLYPIIAMHVQSQCFPYKTIVSNVLVDVVVVAS